MKVSVIIPAYNSQASIGKVLDSVLNQTRPADEVIVVDNGSKDETKKIVAQYPTVILLEENQVQSSYAARNKAIRQAQGDVLAFIDADCVASDQWLQAGLQALFDEADDVIVGGKVEFSYSEKKTAAEYYDSLRHFNFEKTIAQNEGTGAGNLFLKKELFERLGLFPEIRSGGDFIWTGKAIERGYKIVFSKDAVVFHPTRQFREILQKQFRTGTGFLHKRLSMGISTWHEFFYFPYCLLKTWPPFRRVKDEIEQDGRPELIEKYRRIVWVTYCCKVAYYCGGWYEIVCEIFRSKKNIKNPDHG